jgi:L-malate glycosyltransferase
MRILHINNERTWRGGERQTLLTAVEQRRQGLDARLACRRGSPLDAAAQAEGLPVLGLSSFMPVALLTLVRAARRSYDLLHCHTGRAHSLAALATLLNHKAMVVSRRVDFVPRNSMFNRWKFRRASRVVCVSKWVAAVMRTWGLPAEQTAVIYEAVPEGTCLPRAEARSELSARTGIRDSRQIVGNIAALVEHKDQATLLRAARAVADRRPEVAFVIVGEGKLKPQLLELRESLNLTGIVYLTGFVPEAQRYLSGFDVFTMSSKMEGLGTIVLDAALAGVPVATTAGGGLPEAVLNEQTGLVVPVGDAEGLGRAILRLLEDAPLAERLAKAARARIAAEFSLTAMTRRYVEVYHQVLAAGRENLVPE